MALTDELVKLREESGARTGLCRTCHWYNQQPPQVQAEFDACVADPAVSNNALREACTRHGLTISRSQFNDHIRDHGKS